MKNPRAPGPVAARQGETSLDTADCNEPLQLYLCAMRTHEESAQARHLEEHPELAKTILRANAVFAAAKILRLTKCDGLIRTGDSLLHVAAMLHSVDAARSLIAHGADVAARNRTGATPLHYAAEGHPGSAGWKPVRQKAVIKFLLAAGANPDAADRRGVTPLHRAVRAHCSKAVNALLSAGADPRLASGSGSTPLHLAVQNTGRPGSGTMAARYQQRQIIALLLKFGARPGDSNGAGRTVFECARGEWLKSLLAHHTSSTP